MFISRKIEKIKKILYSQALQTIAMPVFLGGIMNFLNTKLPQNIEIEFSRGNYKAVEEMIKFYLKREKIPNSLKNRLEYLKINIKKIRNRYKYNKNQIMSLFKERFTDFSEEELEKYKLTVR